MDPEEIRRLARLARLNLSPGEAERMGEELTSILAHLEALKRLPPLAQAPPAGDPAPPAPLREDTPGAEPLRIPPEEIAPAWEEGFFVVPRLAALDPEAEAG